MSALNRQSDEDSQKIDGHHRGNKDNQHIEDNRTVRTTNTTRTASQACLFRVFPGLFSPYP